MRVAGPPPESQTDLAYDHGPCLPPINKSKPITVHKAHTNNDPQHFGTNGDDGDLYSNAYEDPDPARKMHAQRREKGRKM